MKKIITAVFSVLTAVSAPVMAQDANLLEGCAKAANVAGVFHEAKQEGAAYEQLITSVAYGVEDPELRDLYYNLISYIFLTKEGEKEKNEMMKEIFLGCAFTELEG